MAATRRPKRWRLHRADGRTSWTLWGLTELPDSTETGASRLASISDIDAEHRTQLALLHAATHDALTGALHKSVFLQQLGHAVARLERHPSTAALLFLDLDQFKELNDRYGHQAGDRVLAVQACRIQTVLRPSDVFGRFGGDEFVVICDELGGRAEAETIAVRLSDALAEPVEVDGRTVCAPVSIGMAVTDDPSIAADRLMTVADQAMYRAKRSGGSRVVTMAAVGVTTSAGDLFPDAEAEHVIDLTASTDLDDLVARIGELEDDLRTLRLTRTGHDNSRAASFGTVSRLLAQARLALRDGVGI